MLSSFCRLTLPHSICFILLSVLLGSCSAPEVEEVDGPGYVLVTIAPYRYFAERLVGDTARVSTLVPPGANMHFFEPTPKQVLAASQADIWFRIGEPFETQVVRSLGQTGRKIEIIDLGTQFSTQDDDHEHSHHHGHSHDLHFWLSPRRVSEQVKQMANVLIARFPQHEEVYAANRDQLVDELETLDVRIATILDYAKTRTLLVSHPAYTYFCKDYGLEQLSIEQEGKDPTPQSLTALIQLARQKGIKRIFVQPQHSSKGAVLVADAIGAEIIDLDPYATDYFDNMRQIAWKFAGY